MDEIQTQNELYGMTQAWSRYNDYLYSIINQLLSLTYAHKYFGSNETCEVLKNIYEILNEEIEHLKQLEGELNNTNIRYIEAKRNFNFEKISKIIIEILDSKNKIEEVSVEESKSTFPELCPISRNTIIQPVTQKKNKGAINCPVIGCKKRVAKEYLHRDLELGYFRKKKQFRKSVENINNNLIKPFILV
ncbi:hypothetical protein MACK_003282 [Theileria orientalis]|uniref:SP-RING-type domain-containing protein n=1 Tax=Theileria orientalis TaxID=68886 RepID=A0A976SIG7_THEOR|nr:hypothetical protein MACK_003282 [Theileria orientalis]